MPESYIMKKNLVVIPIAALLLSGCGKTIKHTISFDPNGGEIDTFSIVVKDGKAIKELPTPTKEGKTFLGWFTGWGEQDIQIDKDTIIEQDYDLIAKWDTYDVSYLNGDNSVLTMETVNAGDLALGTDLIPAKSPDEDYCYYFDKWDFDFQIAINKDYLISASWETESIWWSNTSMASIITNKTYEYPFIFKNSLFSQSATIFNGELAEYAFGLSLANQDIEHITSFLNDADFADIFNSDAYLNTTEHSIGFTFAHRSIGEENLLVAAIRGFSYSREWNDNLTLGSSGNHVGFNNAAENVYTNLKIYASNNNINLAKTKILVSGYSRGGAVSNLLGTLIMSDLDIDYSEDNVYVYTFEAPAPMALENVGNYHNIWNVINSGDLITKIPPKEYGLYRAGQDIDIYDSNVNTLLKAFDRSLSIPDFKTGSNYSSDAEYQQYFIEQLLEYEDDVDANPKLSISTRDQFYNNAQEYISYVMGIFFNLKDETTKAISDDLNSKSLISLLVIIGSENGLYNYLLPFIQNDGAEYDDAALKTSLEFFRLSLTTGALSPLLQEFMTNPDHLNRAIYMHAPEVNYVLLEHFLGNF